MATKIKSELSKKNKYWIDKHRYYELKHFCMQYPEWKRELASINLVRRGTLSESGSIKTNHNESPVEKYIEKSIYYTERIDIVERTAKMTDEFLGKYILQAVTEGYSYEEIKSKLEIPCCREVYYKMYRRFFWILDRERC